MAWRKMKLGTALSLGGIVAAAPLVAACGGPSYEDWAATDGAAGRINLDDVQDAFKDSDSVTEFEKRVNEIYEGDGLVLIRAKQDGEVLTLEGWEDLNNDNSIDDASDDQLFSIVRGTNDDYEMRGYHANGYYNSHWGPGNFLFTYLLISAVTPRFGGYYYSTPTSRGSDIRSQRTTYRNSSAYGRQSSRNASYNSRQASFAGSRYQSSRGNVSSNRTSYRSTQRTSGSFRTSNSISRSSSVRSSSGGFGGFGGGGAFRVRRGS